MGFSLKKIGRSVTSLARAAAPVLSVIPGPTMLVGTAASAGFAARDAVKAQKQQKKADAAFQAASASETATIATAGFTNADEIFSGIVGAGPQAPATDSAKTGNATAFNLSSITSKLNPLYIVLGVLVLVLVFLVARRK